MMDLLKYWIEIHDLLEKEGEEMCNSQSVAFGLLDVYDNLTENQQDKVNSILVDWLISDNNKLRYDAAFLISQRRIKSLASTVEKAIIIANSRSGPEAFYEAKKLRRILEDLK